MNNKTDFHYYAIHTVAMLILTIMIISCNGQTVETPETSRFTLLEEVVDIPEVATVDSFAMAAEDVEQVPEVAVVDKETLMSGVVLIQTMYYYKLTFGNQELEVYFSDVDEDGDPINLTWDEDEIQPRIKYGTGFLVDKKGLIATNSHVVNPTIDPKNVRSSLLNELSTMSDKYQNEINDLGVIISVCVNQIAETDDADKKGELLQMIKEYRHERDEKQGFVNEVYRLYGMEYTLTCEREIGIAFNDTYITKQSDFLGCVPKGEDKENDLALIQLKRKGADVPMGSYVFEVPMYDAGYSSEVETNVHTIDKDLFMLAFNLGPTLALTDDGIEAQCTSGKCSRVEHKTIMYDISSLPGSSGAPVIDAHGNLFAVNHAGISSTQGFNEGVKAYLLSRLLEQN